MFEEVFFSATSQKKVSVVAAEVSFFKSVLTPFSRGRSVNSRIECYHLVSYMSQSWLCVIVNMADRFEHHSDVI